MRDAAGTDAAEKLPDAPAPGPLPSWQPVGMEIGVASTAWIGVVVITVRVRPGKAGYVNVLVVVGRGGLKKRYRQPMLQ